MKRTMIGWHVATLFGLYMLNGAAFAQASSELSAQNASGRASHDSAARGILPPVKIEAFRLDQDILSTPAAVDVIEHPAISRGQRKAQLDSALNRIPGVYASNGSNFAQNLRLSIRGFGARSAFGVRGVRILVDGIPQTLVDGQGQTDIIDPGSIERIEVLRGSLSSLYGNATGGVVEISTLAPEDGPVNKIELSGGSYGYLRASAASARQFDDWGYATIVTRLQQHGYREHSDVERNHFIGKLTHDVGRDGKLALITHLLYAPGTQDPGAITRGAAQDDRRAARDANLAYDARKDSSQETFGAVFEDSLSEQQDYKLHAFYSHRDFTQYLPFGSANGGGVPAFKRNFFGGGAQTTRHDDVFGRANQLILGIEAQRQRDKRRRYNNDFGSIGAKRLEQTEIASNYAIFLQDEFNITPSLAATFGARYDWLNFKIHDQFTTDGDQSGQRRYRQASVNFGLSYAWTDQQHIYANIANAFESPTFTEFANPADTGGFNPNLGPQKAVNYEIGAKGEVGNRGRYQIGLFQVDVRGAITPFAERGDRTYYQNSGRSRRRGLESKFSLDLTDQLTAVLAFTLAEYEFRHFVAENGQDYSGNRLPGIAQDTVFSELLWQPDDTTFAAVNIHWVGSVYTDDANETRVSPHTVVNTRAGKRFALGQHDLSLYAGIDNLFNEYYFDNIRINSFGGRYFEPAPGRTLYVGLQAEF